MLALPPRSTRRRTATAPTDGPRPVRKPSSHKDRGEKVRTTNHLDLLRMNKTTSTSLFEDFNDSRESGSFRWHHQAAPGNEQAVGSVGHS